MLKITMIIYDNGTKKLGTALLVPDKRDLCPQMWCAIRYEKGVKYRKKLKSCFLCLAEIMTKRSPTDGPVVTVQNIDFHVQNTKTTDQELEQSVHRIFTSKTSCGQKIQRMITKIVREQ